MSKDDSTKKIDAFTEFVGEIGENYDEDKWFMNLGVFGLGWDKAKEDAAKEIEKARVLQFSPTGDNHHNAALCPHCGEPLREAARLLRSIMVKLPADSVIDADKFLKDNNL